MKVKEVAELVGVSVRTLHYYDEIGLLVPKTTDSGYRIYSDQDLEKLQQILFFKELGFPLKQIKEMMENPAFDRLEALKLQREMLLARRRQLDEMIETIEKTIQHVKGEVEMTNKDMFKGFDFRHNPYEQEARERWGDLAVDQANEKVKNMTETEKEKFHKIFHDLAAIRHLPPDSQEAQHKINEWYQYLNTFGTYTLDMFKGLGKMYVDDERFKNNIDRFGEGLAEFMCEAMAVFADKKKKKSPR